MTDDKKEQFITEYGSHLGNPSFFLVTAINYFDVRTERLSPNQARFQILEHKIPFLHQSLMTDAERNEIYKMWF